MKRRRSSSSSANTYVTADSLVESSYAPPLSLKREVSPPPVRKKSGNSNSATAQVEAGEATVQDHVAFFASKLLGARLPELPGQARISHGAWLGRYHQNMNDLGHHFVIHQHDHPVAGTHYDLRLQCNATSSISFAIMYGLPGDPNSRRPNRNATETRVHNLWNHLIETASEETGTMLIWDTGEYEVLPYSNSEQAAAPDSESETDTNQSAQRPDHSIPSETQKLAHSFARRKIRLRLHGTRLPPSYTISLRLTPENFRSEQPSAPSFRRPGRSRAHQKKRRASTTSDTDSDLNMPAVDRTVSSLQATASPPSSPPPAASQEDNEAVRANNAYPGATNSIGSIHQRKWYLSLDRTNSGFMQTKKPPPGHHVQTYWVRSQKAGGEGRERFEKFHVLGRDYERSVVTGRLAKDILADEGVENFVPRSRWTAVIE